MLAAAYQDPGYHNEDGDSADRPARRPQAGGAMASVPDEASLPLETRDQVRASHPCFGLIGTALSKKISVFQSGSLKVVPISPNAS